jgi:hypothetical protein
MKHIFINGYEDSWYRERLSYEDAVKLVTGDPGVLHTVTYKAKGQEGGSLTPGQSVAVVDGMRFNAVVTGAG